MQRLYHKMRPNRYGDYYTADLVVDEVQYLSKIPDFFKKSGIYLCTSLT